jgi:hypothetical protein
MASTRNKNTPGDYASEKKAIQLQVDYNTYHSYGVPSVNYLPGDGLLSGKVASASLSNNFCDIESYLRGIGSTNLETPQPEIVPSIKQLKSLAVMEKTPLIVPGDLVVEHGQRPFRGIQ